MFNSIALSVVIGLIFIYLLYSLLATILSEMIASFLGLRARNLQEAISRMLNGDGEMVKRVYSNPEIKYLGGNRRFRKPAFLKPSSFSKALVNELSGDGSMTAEKMNAVLQSGAEGSQNGGSGGRQGALDAETSAYLLRLWQEAGADLDQFRLLLEEWFDRTMEQASEWYKRKIQVVLLILGFCMAWFFYADTFMIVKTLSNDTRAREQMVSLASAYIQTNPGNQDTSLLEIKKKLDADISNANTILGLGGWLPNSTLVVFDPITREKTYSPPLDPSSLSATDRKISNGTLNFSFGKKLGYLFRLAWHHFFGFLITAIAISLGAPFWFDLLNKVMKLRMSGQPKPRKK